MICEDDEGGQMFAIRCPGALFPELEPYAEELLSWRADPSAQDQPIIPIFFPEDGSPLFYPQADCPESQGCLTKAPPELLIHIQNASSGLTAPLSVSFLSRILKSASDSG